MMPVLWQKTIWVFRSEKGRKVLNFLFKSSLYGTNPSILKVQCAMKTTEQSVIDVGKERGW